MLPGLCVLYRAVSLVYRYGLQSDICARMDNRQVRFLIHTTLCLSMHTKKKKSRTCVS